MADMSESSRPILASTSQNEVQSGNIGRQIQEMVAINQEEKMENIENQLKAIKVAEWKKTLTGALDDQRLFGALGVLCVFYVGYVLFNGVHNNNDNDEDDIVNNCTCKSAHKSFYIGWSYFCFSLWFLWHIIIFLKKESPALIAWCKARCCNNVEATSYSINAKTLARFKRCKSFFAATCGCWYYNKKINRYESYLWTRYCELYVVGITKNEENFNLDNVQKYIAKALHEADDSTDHGGQRGKEDTWRLSHHDQLAVSASTKTSNAPPAESSLRVSYPKRGLQYVIQWVIHVVLFIIRLAAQAVIVPLLMIQMFDTYAFLCFASGNYCSMRAEYRLHLDQTAITFGFYCSLMISLLATTMLRWIPYPKKIPKQDNINYDENFTFHQLPCEHPATVNKENDTLILY